MSKFEDVKKRGEIYICDSCKKDIFGSKVVLVEAADNIEILTPMMPFIFVDKDDVITGGSKQAQKDKGDKLLACPHCKTAHLFGFSLKG